MGRAFRKKVYAACGYNTIYFGPGRKEFSKDKPMPPFEGYLKETAEGTLLQMSCKEIDQGIIGSFMSQKFIDQANLAGFLPFMVKQLLHKPCTGVEGACGTGGRAIAMGISSILSDLSDATFVSGCEFQNSVKSVYGADALAGAGYYRGERKKGDAYFFPGTFARRGLEYVKKYGQGRTREALAKWYELAIVNARKNTKAQEYQNTSLDLYALGLTPPDPDKFLPFLNAYDCSKVSDGASSLMLFSEEGLQKCGIDKRDAIEIIAMGSSVGDITKPPEDPTFFTNTHFAVQKALAQAGLKLSDIGLIEVHDCFTISGLLAIEAMGFAAKGGGPDFILEGHTKLEGKIPTNPSGGLIGFGHATGASGLRQLVDLHAQLTGRAENQVMQKRPYAMMVSMGGNDVTVTCLIVRRA